MFNIISNLKRTHKKLLGLNERNLNYIYPNNPRENYKYADDKIVAKQLLERHNLACPKTYASISKIGEIESIWANMKVNKSMVIKPSMGRGGDGVKLIRQNKGNWILGKQSISEEQIFLHIANILFGMFSYGKNDRALIEELIVPHPFLTDIYSDGVADIRIIVHDHIPIMGMLRLPTDESEGKANLHQGGLGVGIEMETGVLTHVFDGKHYIKTHPDSNQSISGLTLPYWGEIIELSIKVAKVFPLNFMGIDIVLDHKKGPMVLEVNIRPGLSIQMANRQGLKNVI